MSKRNTVIFMKMFKAQMINYFTDPTNIVLNFVITSVTMLAWIGLKPVGQDGFSSDPFVLASAMAIASIRNSQHSFTVTMVDWRRKRFFRSLAKTPISKKLVYLCIFVFNWFINIIIALFLFSLGMLFKNQRSILWKVDVVPLIIGFVLNVILSNVLALLTVQLFKNREVAIIVALFAYFGPIYLLGLGIPWNVTGQIKELNMFTYLFPHRYPLNIIQSAWSGTSSNMMFPGVESNTWLGKQGFGYGGNGWWLPAVITIGWIVLFFTGFVLMVNKTYNWKNKLSKYQQVSTYSFHADNIKKIKYANNVEELNESLKEINLEYKIRKKVKKDSKKHLKKVGDVYA